MPTKKKLGRPTNNPKCTSIHVRLDAECEEIIGKYHQQEDITKVEAIRRGIKKLKDDIKQ